MRLGRPGEIEAVLPASAAMFEEEVGFSPYVEGRESYVRRVQQLLARQHLDWRHRLRELCQMLGIPATPQLTRELHMLEESA